MAHTRKAAILIIDELQEKLKNQDIALAKRLEWIRKVEAQNAALLAALRAILTWDDMWTRGKVGIMAIKPLLAEAEAVVTAIERAS